MREGWTEKVERGLKEIEEGARKVRLGLVADAELRQETLLRLAKSQTEALRWREYARKLEARLSIRKARRMDS